MYYNSFVRAFLRSNGSNKAVITEQVNMDNIPIAHIDSCRHKNRSTSENPIKRKATLKIWVRSPFAI